MTFVERLEMLEEDEEEWGEIMDIVAASSYYAMNFKVVSYGRSSRRSFTQDIKAFSSDSSINSNANDCNRIIFYVYGRNHFQVGHPID